MKMTDEKMKAELTTVVARMGEVGFADALVVMGEHRGQPIAGVRGTWNGEQLEYTFIRGQFDDVSVASARRIIERKTQRTVVTPA